jgi:hypothetical protein
MRALMTALTNYAASRADEEAQSGAVRFFRKLKAGLEDRQREMSICRQRLTHLRRALEIPETAGASICGGPSPTVELVLPDGGQEVEWAAKRFVETIPPDAIGKLDRVLQALVLEPRGGLFGACQKSGDFIQELADPMVPGRGSIHIADSIWRVEGPELPKGARITVVGADGTLLKVTATGAVAGGGLAARLPPGG